jgi:putative nucleotidyltransferase with HDIG domain
MIRAIRFACQLDFVLEGKTEREIAKMASSIRFVANERVRDEFIKIISSDKAYDGIMLLYRDKLMRYILPELLWGDGMAQDRHHLYSVFKHNTLSLKNCPSPDWRVRLAALLHDVGKPPTLKKRDGVATFYNHEHVSAKLARKIMKRLKFSSEDTEKVVTLVRNHMFYYNVGEVTESSVRRLIRKVGRENLRDLIDVRIADRLGSGVPKGEPYKLRHLQYVMEKVQNDPVSVKMLKLNGNDLISELGLKPGPKIGAILDVLLSEVIEDPKLNNREYLLKRARELKNDDLDMLREKAKDVIGEKQKEDDRKMRRQYKVK